MAKNNGHAWSHFGLIFLAASLYLGYTGVTYETAIATPYVSGILDIQQTQSVQNLGLMLNKLLLIGSALALLIVGVMCFSACAILRQLYVPDEIIPDS